MTVLSTNGCIYFYTAVFILHLHSSFARMMPYLFLPICHPTGKKTDNKVSRRHQGGSGRSGILAEGQGGSSGSGILAQGRGGSGGSGCLTGASWAGSPSGNLSGSVRTGHSSGTIRTGRSYSEQNEGDSPTGSSTASVVGMGLASLQVGNKGHSGTIPELKSGLRIGLRADSGLWDSLWADSELRSTDRTGRRQPAEKCVLPRHAGQS